MSIEIIIYTPCNAIFKIFYSFRAYLMAPKLSVDDLRYIFHLWSALFEPDNIRDGKSVEALASWGGYEGLEKALRTNFQVL